MPQAVGTDRSSTSAFAFFVGAGLLIYGIVFVVVETSQRTGVIPLQQSVPCPKRTAADAAATQPRRIGPNVSKDSVGELRFIVVCTFMDELTLHPFGWNRSRVWESYSTSLLRRLDHAVPRPHRLDLFRALPSPDEDQGCPGQNIFARLLRRCSIRRCLHRTQDARVLGTQYGRGQSCSGPPVLRNLFFQLLILGSTRDDTLSAEAIPIRCIIRRNPERDASVPC